MEGSGDVSLMGTGVPVICFSFMCADRSSLLKNTHARQHVGMKNFASQSFEYDKL